MCHRIVKSTKKREDFHTLFTLVNTLLALVIKSIHKYNTEMKSMRFYPIKKD